MALTISTCPLPKYYFNSENEIYLLKKLKIEGKKLGCQTNLYEIKCFPESYDSKHLSSQPETSHHMFDSLHNTKSIFS